MKIVAQNRRARFDYQIADTIEAGIMLTGQEVKSCRLGQVSLAGSYVSFLSGKPMIKQLKISPYKYATVGSEYDPSRDRPLLLKGGEIERLTSASEQKGSTIIPLEMRAGKFVKLLLGVAQGRKKLDKRQKIKEREVERRMRRGGE